MFWLRNKKVNFPVLTLNWGPDIFSLNPSFRASSVYFTYLSQMTLASSMNWLSLDRFKGYWVMFFFVFTNSDRTSCKQKIIARSDAALCDQPRFALFVYPF